MIRTLLLCILILCSTSIMAQDITCTQIGNQTNCSQRPVMVLPTVKPYDIGASMDQARRTYNEARQRALDQQEQQLRIDLLQQQKAQAISNQQQAPVYLGSDPNRAATYEEKCGAGCCKYAGISNGMGNKKAYSVLLEKLKLTGYGETVECQNIINQHFQWGASIARKPSMELTAQDIETISTIKSFEAQF